MLAWQHHCSCESSCSISTKRDSSHDYFVIMCWGVNLFHFLLDESTSEICWGHVSYEVSSWETYLRYVSSLLIAIALAIVNPIRITTSPTYLRYVLWKKWCSGTYLRYVPFPFEESHFVRRIFISNPSASDFVTWEFFPGNYSKLSLGVTPTKVIWWRDY